MAEITYALIFTNTFTLVTLIYLALKLKKQRNTKPDRSADASKHKKIRPLQQTGEKSWLLSKALELLREGLVIMDPGGRLVYTNKFARMTLGIDENYHGKPYHETISDLDVISFINNNFNAEYRLWDNKNINKHFVQIIFASDMDEKVLLIHDLTQIKKYENLKKDFIANVSHEFKTPVATLKLLMETLEDECRENKNAERFVKKAIDRVKYMEQLIQDLITLSLLETSKGITLDIKPLNLKRFIDEIIEEVEFIANEKNITIENMIDENIQIKTDRKMLYAAFKNLIDNAIKYNIEGGKVHLKYSKLPREHEIDICDTGQGIPKSHIPFIFERFYRVDKSRSRKLGGTGLGLSIVKLAIEKINGKIMVDSEPGKGTCFKVFIPKEFSKDYVISTYPEL